MTCLRWLMVGMFVLMAGRLVAEPLGMACHIKGQPEVSSNNSQKWEPLRLLQKLEAGDTIRCNSGSEVTVVLFGNGERFQIAAGQKATVQNGSVSGAKPLGGLKGPSALAVQKLGGARTGAMLARPAMPVRRTYNKFPDWLTPDTRTLTWDKNANAAVFDFALYDTGDNDEVIWFHQTNSNTLDLPANLKLVPHRPYVWRLSARNADGVSLKRGSQWGVLTLLSTEDVSALNSEEMALQKQAKDNSEDALPLLLLAERYRSYGLLLRTLESLEDAASRNEETTAQQIDVYKHLGGLGHLFAARLKAPTPYSETKQEGKQ